MGDNERTSFLTLDSGLDVVAGVIRGPIIHVEPVYGRQHRIQILNK